MKNALHDASNTVVMTLFSETTHNLMQAIDNMVLKLSHMILCTALGIRQSLTTVYSVCWEDHADKSTFVDVQLQQKMRECRDKLLPSLNSLRKAQDESMTMLGIERDDLELELMAVDTLEEQLDKKLKAATASGDVIDLTGDSDDGDDNAFTKQPSRFVRPAKVKREPSRSV